jgi:Calcineurin-like phosphoesterase
VGADGRWRRRAGACLLVLLLLASYLPRLAAHATRAVEPACQTTEFAPPYADVIALTLDLCLDVGPERQAVTEEVEVHATYDVQRGPFPGIRSVLFLLDDAELLTDFNAPFQFTWETRRWPDGDHQLVARARLRNGDVATVATSVTLTNQGNLPPPVAAFTPPEVSSPPADRPIVLAAVGDGPDGGPGAAAVSELIAAWDPDLFLFLGDVYEDGRPDEFANWYTHAFGPLRDRTLPTPGNHEFEAGEATGYFAYWGDPPPFYATDAGRWHLSSLNSSGPTRDMAPGSDQYAWLAEDLAAHGDDCTIVFFHHPVFSIGPQGDTERMRPMWQLLVDHGVELVLTGHDHDYQRWQPLDAAGAPADRGPTEFVVGTGGHGIQAFDRDDPRVVAGSDETGAYGALRLELYPDQAAFTFVTVDGATRDAGTIPCDARAS